MRGGGAPCTLTASSTSAITPKPGARPTTSWNTSPCTSIGTPGKLSELSVDRLAYRLDVTPQWVRQLRARLVASGELLVQQSRGRHPNVYRIRYERCPACPPPNPKRLCCKNWLEGEEGLVETARYAANPNSWLIIRFCPRTSPLATPSSWPLRSMCMAS